MNYKNFLIVLLVLSVFLIGCNGVQNLTEEELEEKAKEHFYSLDDVDVFGVSFKSSDFILEKTEVIQPKVFESYNLFCKVAITGNCLLDENEFYSINEQVYLYDFQLKEEVKRDDRTMWGKVILKNNGELIAYYITGMEHAI